MSVQRTGTRMKQKGLEFGWIIGDEFFQITVLQDLAMVELYLT